MYIPSNKDQSMYQLKYNETHKEIKKEFSISNSWLDDSTDFNEIIALPLSYTDFETQIFKPV